MSALHTYSSPLELELLSEGTYLVGVVVGDQEISLAHRQVDKKLLVVELPVAVEPPRSFRIRRVSEKHRLRIIPVLANQCHSVSLDKR